MCALKHEERRVPSIADKAVYLYLGGNTSPSNKDISRALEMDEEAETLSPGVVRAYLPQARQHLEEHYEHVVCLVADAYYDLGYAPGAPPTEAAARDCIALGRGNQSAGLYFVTDENDPVWIQWRLLALMQARGKRSANVRRIARQVKDQKLAPKHAIRLMEAYGQPTEAERQLPRSVRKLLGDGEGRAE